MWARRWSWSWNRSVAGAGETACFPQGYEIADRSTAIAFRIASRNRSASAFPLGWIFSERGPATPGHTRDLLLRRRRFRPPILARQQALCGSDAGGCDPRAVLRGADPALPRPARAAQARRRPAEATRARLSAEKRLLVLDAWLRSKLPAGDFAPLVGTSLHRAPWRHSPACESWVAALVRWVTWPHLAELQFRATRSSGGSPILCYSCLAPRLVTMPSPAFQFSVQVAFLMSTPIGCEFDIAASIAPLFEY